MPLVIRRTGDNFMLLTPPLPYRLRAMEVADIDTVMLIERRAFNTPWSAVGYKHELLHNERAHYVVLTRQEANGSEHILGYAGYWIILDEAHVSIIAVDPEWRGQGLGALLLLQMIYHALAMNVSMIGLEVRESNDEAQALYRRYGFEPVGMRRRYYRDTNEDAIIMDLNLTQQQARPTLEALREALWQRLSRNDFKQEKAEH